MIHNRPQQAAVVAYQNENQYTSGLEEMTAQGWAFAAVDRRSARRGKWLWGLILAPKHNIFTVTFLRDAGAPVERGDAAPAI